MPNYNKKTYIMNDYSLYKVTKIKNDALYQMQHIQEYKGVLVAGLTHRCSTFLFWQWVSAKNADDSIPRKIFITQYNNFGENIEQCVRRYGYKKCKETLYIPKRLKNLIDEYERNRKRKRKNKSENKK